MNYKYLFLSIKNLVNIINKLSIVTLSLNSDIINSRLSVCNYTYLLYFSLLFPNDMRSFMLRLKSVLLFGYIWARGINI